ncbi:hypothetical protein OQ483_23745 (plasmid) [Enterobacter bugandensis]|uniref:hypothetical protein n=1 Tax=Enterobacter bugandensis TaxID=881260 RepID=UPI00283A9424|nr:hypothetical protein [Enterobacter bugandensis]WMU75410.1 hypothetical protein OQ483_23745 [Enterobacter bugandensis]
MSGTVKKGIDLTALQKRFSAWHVPDDADFSQLTDAVSQLFSPGAGLAGGDPSMSPDTVDADNVQPLSVHKGGGITLQAGGVALSVNSENPDSMTLASGRLAVNPQKDGGLSTDGGLAVKVIPSGGLAYGADGISMPVPGAGLKLNGNQLVLDADQQALRTGPQGVYICCRPGGGLGIENGCLVVDIGSVLQQTAKAK